LDHKICTTQSPWNDFIIIQIQVDLLVILTYLKWALTWMQNIIICFFSKASMGEFAPKFEDKYLLLTQFEGRTVNYRPSFSPSSYGPSVKRTGHKSKGKNEDL